MLCPEPNSTAVRRPPCRAALARPRPLAAALAVLLAACQSIEPPRPETDPSQPPPAPITPPASSLPPQGQVVTAPLPGQPPPAPVIAPARIGLREAQRLLAGMGYDPGPADGVAGRRTTAALRAFQRDHGLPTSGRLDDATRQALARPSPR